MVVCFFRAAGQARLVLRPYYYLLQANNVSSEEHFVFYDVQDWAFGRCGTATATAALLLILVVVVSCARPGENLRQMSARQRFTPQVQTAGQSNLPVYK